jgi:topoisomerase-4 subunit B
VTFFLQFFPELIRRDHLYILETPLFRVRNRKITRYCYNETEKEKAVRECGAGAEITRFKGLGEISSHEMRNFIGKDMRLEPVRVSHGASIRELLEFYMGKNTPERQQFIIENLRVEADLVAEGA